MLKPGSEANLTSPTVNTPAPHQQLHGSLDKILVQGSWAAARAARTYMLARCVLFKTALLLFLCAFVSQGLFVLPHLLERARAAWRSMEGAVLKAGL